MFRKKFIVFAMLVYINQWFIETKADDEKLESNNILLGPIVSGFDEAANSATVLRLMLDHFGHANVSQSCQFALSNLTEGLDDGSFAALKFVDATAKIPPGISQGSLTFLGSFDECLDSDYPSKQRSLFHGKYCSVYVHPGAKITKALRGFGYKGHGLRFRFDLCLPNACTETDITETLNNVRNLPLKLLRTLGATITAGVCQTRDPKAYSNGQITAIILFSLLGVLLLIATLLDVITRLRDAFSSENGTKIRESSLLFHALLSFSMYTNGISLLNIKMAADSLPAFNGVRFISMSWVILGHCYLFVLPNYNLLGNLLQVAPSFENFALQSMLNATVSVDSFFFISGFLVAYIVIRELDKKGTMNWGLYVFHRIWRLTPGLTAMILLALLFPLLGSGPTWADPNISGIGNCQTYWWTNLLFINNFTNDFHDMCLMHGWYLANDTQFYIVAPLILLAYHKKPVWGCLVNFAFLVTSIVVPIIINIQSHYQYSPTWIMDSFKHEAPTIALYYRDIYIKPYCRMGPYCVGIYAGYFMIKKKELNLSRLTKAIIWCLAIACNTSVLYGVLQWNRGNSGFNLIGTIYMATHRTAWAIGLAWVIVCCLTGNGGVVNSILSWKLFAPLGRLTYLVYLIHPFVQVAYMGMARERLMYTDYTHVTTSLGLMLVSYGFAFFASLAVEAPFMKLEKIIFSQANNDEVVEKPTSPNEHYSNGVTNKSFQEEAKV